MLSEEFNPNYSHYFITLNTKYRKRFFGEIVNGQMVLSKAGIIAYLLWYQMANNRPYLDRAEFVVMPDHIHGILSIDKNIIPDEIIKNPKLEGTNVLETKIGYLIKSYKSTVKKFTNIFQLEMIWQEGMHNEFIWSYEELNIKRKYIENNIKSWEEK